MKTALYVLIFLLLKSNVSFSQDDRISTDNGFSFYNGRLWNTFSSGEKEQYLLGLYDGIVMLTLIANGKLESASCILKLQDAKDELYLSGFTFEEIAKEINVFFSSTTNIRIPIIQANRYIVGKFKGENSDALNDLLTNLRKIYNK